MWTPVRAASIAAVALAVSAASVQAQLPTVAQIYDRFATAVGGRAAWATVHHRAEQGTARIAYAGIVGTYERYYAPPNKFRMTIAFAGGKVEQGTNGTVVWGSQPGAPAVKLPAADATAILESNVTGNAFLDPRRYAKSSVVGKELFDGVSCYRVFITTKSGREKTEFFEVETGLRRGQVVIGPDGEQKSVYRDYKNFEGRLLATTNVQSNAAGDVIITVSTVHFRPNDPALFQLPAGMTP
ncbi:MAG: hypothetical protein IT353_07200 [Gemmatimonadaceae bacterium]|nr:hypothetical protein [Gemmatimonadaceae bacterium]